jgi:hypothetical protein
MFFPKGGATLVHEAVVCGLYSCSCAKKRQGILTARLFSPPGKGGGIIREAHVFAINDAGMYRGAVSSDSPVIRTALHGDEKLK